MTNSITVKRGNKYSSIATGRIVTVTNVIFATADGDTAGYVECITSDTITVPGIEYQIEYNDFVARYVEAV